MEKKKIWRKAREVKKYMMVGSPVTMFWWRDLITDSQSGRTNIQLSRAALLKMIITMITVTLPWLTWRARSLLFGPGLTSLETCRASQGDWLGALASCPRRWGPGGPGGVVGAGRFRGVFLTWPRDLFVGSELSGSTRDKDQFPVQAVEVLAPAVSSRPIGPTSAWSPPWPNITTICPHCPPPTQPSGDQGRIKAESWNITPASGNTGAAEGLEGINLSSKVVFTGTLET